MSGGEGKSGSWVEKGSPREPPLGSGGATIILVRSRGEVSLKIKAAGKKNGSNQGKSWLRVKKRGGGGEARLYEGGTS